MKFIKKFFWELVTNYKKLMNIEVEYKLITISGKEILTIKENMKPIKPFIVNYNDWKYWDYVKEIKKDYIAIFDKRAEEILDEYKNKERKKIKQGWLDSGNYIVKCVWNIYPGYEYVAYEEVKE